MTIITPENSAEFKRMFQEWEQAVAHAGTMLRREGRAEATLTKVEWLLSLAIPDLGSSSVKTIRPIEILDVLRKVEKRGR